MNRLWWIPLACLTLAACTEGDDDDAADDDSGPVEGSLALADEQNYSYDNALDIQSVEVQTAQDVRFDFGGLSVDLLGHAIDPTTEIDGASVLYLPAFTHEEVEVAIATDSLLQQDVGAFALWSNPGGETSFLLSECNVLGTYIDPAADFVYEEGTWLVRVTTGTNESRMISFFQPSSTSENHDVAIGDGSATIDFDPDLQSLAPVHMSGEPESYVVDWSGVTVDGLGGEFDPNQISEVMVGRYDGMSLGDLETQFLDLELIAGEIYYAAVSQTTHVDLTTATALDGGGAFSTFGSGSLWLLALRCTSCVSPIPPFLTVIEVDG
ncbi:hypothetical protein L6R50_20080 [Myxococcota bacterium]|nr:hypothetical protein [Myxococcota bacterium]